VAEGGHFALYALLRKKKSRWIIYPALLAVPFALLSGIYRL
jgi:hypothetical protein